MVFFVLVWAAVSPGLVKIIISLNRLLQPDPPGFHLIKVLKKNSFFLFLVPLLAGVSFFSFETTTLQTDGPYVFYRDNRVFVHRVMERDRQKFLETDSFLALVKTDKPLLVPTGEPGEYFTVRIRPGHRNEKPEYRKVSRQLVISDMEGNLKAFIRLLRGTGVIDKSFNWTFGDGHLVLAGDFFDRGTQVTELLWLVYSLEEKAKAAGGYVHFILGNHEIMNLNGDFRYVHPRYFEHAALMNLSYYEVFNENTELGRWLRSKNIVERVGDILYIHGGISPLLNRFNIPAPGINQQARPFYADSSYLYPDLFTEVLFSDLGPFWYRGYYTGMERPGIQQVDSTLRLFGARYITTGHTIAADTISVWYNNKVFNTDVPHYSGKSEALLYEKGLFYRVSQHGEKFRIGG